MQLRDELILLALEHMVSRASLRKLSVWAIDNGLVSLRQLDSENIWEKLQIKKEQQYVIKKALKKDKPTKNIKKIWPVITILDPHYPDSLKRLKQPPAVLFYRGDSQLLNQSYIAVVGTRNMTEYGRWVTDQLVWQAASFGWGVVSGGMIGVDWSAHQACLEATMPSVAVLGYGQLHPYPANWMPKLLELVDKGGLVITEYSPDTPGKSFTFPERNRVVAALAQAVVVVEAGVQSGSHITANLALGLGLPVGAVPGPVGNRFSEGTKNLINQGAKLVTQIEDILEEIPGWSVSQPSSIKKEALTYVVPSSWPTARKDLYQLLVAPLTTDQVVTKLQLPLTQVLSELGQLELFGGVIQQGERWIRQPLEQR